MIHCTKAEALRYQNGINNAQGQAFEGYIISACKLYARQGRAMIEKTPEPFKVKEKERVNGKATGRFTGRFTTSAQPDFKGTLAGGRSIVFEAKYTTTEKMAQNVLTDAQTESLEKHQTLGAIAAICIGIQEHHFFLPYRLWQEMKNLYGRKYIKAVDVEPYAVKFPGEVRFLDYCRPTMRPWWIKEANHD